MNNIDKHTTEYLRSLIDSQEVGITHILEFSDSDWEVYWKAITADHETFFLLNRLIHKPLSFETYSEFPLNWACDVQEALLNVDKEYDEETFNLFLRTLVPFINERNAPIEDSELEPVEPIVGPNEYNTAPAGKPITKTKPRKALDDIKSTETYKQFMYEIPHFIYSEVAKSVNQLCGLSKTSSMIANLFTTLPLQIELRHITDQPKPRKKLNALEEFTHAYLKHDDSTKVIIAFWYDSEKHIKRISKAIHKHPEFFAYLYMREALKLTRRMNTATHYRMMSSIIKHTNPAIPATAHYKYSIQACNYAVNETIKQLFAASPLADKFNTIIEGQAFDPDYATLSEMDIVAKLATATDSTESEQFDSGFVFDFLFNSIFLADTNGALPVDEHIQTDLGETLENHLGSMSRGTGSAAIFGQFFTAKKVSTGWFKKLAAKFSKDVYYMTNTFKSQWSSLNITYRHKFKAPKASYEDNKLSVILSVDHSGSVSTEGLQQLLYLFEKQSKRITQLIVLIHDTEIVKEFTIKSDFDIKSNPDFLAALSNRYAVGGTSHSAVFSRINDMLTTKQIDPSKSIYISFSDNLSDIPASIAKYPAIKQLSVTFLVPKSNPMNIKGCTDISMQ